MLDECIHKGEEVHELTQIILGVGFACQKKEEDCPYQLRVLNAYYCCQLKEEDKVNNDTGRI